MTHNIIHDIFLQKLADITDIPVEYVQKMRDKGMLDQQAIRDIMVQRDYWALHRTGKLKSRLIVSKLADFYHVSASKIYNALQSDFHRVFCCKRCGIQLSKDAYEQGDGLCGKCIANSINI